jgi:DNA invertase Pin-like site-specific DNA recombinase
MIGFQELMKDCRNGKIDLILIKSISRLGRNTVQFLNSCDELKALNVEVFFEVENIYISDLNATVLMTVQESMFTLQVTTSLHSITKETSSGHSTQA